MDQVCYGVWSYVAKCGHQQSGWSRQQTMSDRLWRKFWQTEQTAKTASTQAMQRTCLLRPDRSAWHGANIDSHSFSDTQVSAPAGCVCSMSCMTDMCRVQRQPSMCQIYECAAHHQHDIGCRSDVQPYLRCSALGIGVYGGACTPKTLGLGLEMHMQVS